MWLMLTLSCFVIALFAHAVLCRMSLRIDFVAKSLLVGVPAGMALGIALVADCGIDIRTVSGLVLYAFLFELYIFFFTLVSTSVSVSLLIKLHDGSLDAGEIASLYSSNTMVEGRFEKMLGVKLITCSEGGYSVTRKARCLLTVYRTIRYFFRHPVAADAL